MPKLFSSEELHTLCVALLNRKGVPRDVSECVAEDLVEANLWGQGGHGVARLPRYLDVLERGEIDPHASVTIERRVIPNAMRLSSSNFGQWAGKQAMDIALQEVQEHGICIQAWRAFHHIGRAGSWTWKAAVAGFIACMFVNTNGAPRVRQFGSLGPKTGTNPASWAIPCEPQPLMADLAAASMVEGKVHVKLLNQQEVPAEVLVDKHGTPTVNPNALYDGGSIRPIGGDAAEHKGAAFAAAMDWFAGLLTLSGCAKPDIDPRFVSRNGAFLVLVRPDLLLEDLSVLHASAQAWLAHMKASPLPGTKEILIASEHGRQLREEQLARGIEIDDGTHKALAGAAKSVELDWDL